MRRRAALGVAGAIALCLAGVAATVEVDLGIVAGQSPTSGPGTFQPLVASSRTTDTVAGTTTTTTVPNLDVDHDGDATPTPAGQPAAHERQGDGRDDDD
jgi:hypothetical protein